MLLVQVQKSTCSVKEQSTFSSNNWCPPLSEIKAAWNKSYLVLSVTLWTLFSTSTPAFKKKQTKTTTATTKTKNTNKEIKQNIMPPSMPTPLGSSRTRNLLHTWPQNRPQRLCQDRLPSTYSHGTLSSHPKQMGTKCHIVTVSQLQRSRGPG